MNRGLGVLWVIFELALLVLWLNADRFPQETLWLAQVVTNGVHALLASLACWALWRTSPSAGSLSRAGAVLAGIAAVLFTTATVVLFI